MFSSNKEYHNETSRIVNLLFIVSWTSNLIVPLVLALRHSQFPLFAQKYQSNSRLSSCNHSSDLLSQSNENLFFFQKGTTISYCIYIRTLLNSMWFVSLFRFSQPKTFHLKTILSFSSLPCALSLSNSWLRSKWPKETEEKWQCSMFTIIIR